MQPTARRRACQARQTLATAVHPAYVAQAMSNRARCAKSSHDLSADCVAYDQIVLNAMASSVLVVDGALRIRFANAAAEQLLGASRSVLLRRRLDDLLPFDSPLFDLLRRVQEEGHSVSDYGVDLPFNRGAARLVDLHVSPVPEMPGGTLVVLHPCSVAHRLNRQLGSRPRWRMRSRTRFRGSAARPSCSRPASPRTSGR
jgi:PAS domain-containing protein